MEKLSQKLKDHKLRNTHARKAIYQLLKKSQFSLSAKEIFNKIEEKSNTDLVSVYRNLTLFTDLGLVHRFQDGRYASCQQEEHSCSKHSQPRHMHFINHCQSCGKSSEVRMHTKEICDLTEQLMKVSTTLNSFEEIVLQGRCRQCSD